ncbi:hypothetical protein H8A99_10195 [Bradyrhizobium sp. Arg68]|uniref:hypothetical protein n=1 Tax=Bradyrhizobium ivorense TaxID=2511166 RepID=UPI001E49B116|nr:hypothetical protein [Bradyrhizobium ivorense]MCC8936845.1 hypothetical protein [Bradyrhizobium ivorense]
MSLAALANDELLRTARSKLDLSTIIDPQLQRLNLNPATINVNEIRSAMKTVAAESPVRENTASSALDGLVKYIPTESVTLYVAATSAISSLTAAFPSVTASGLYLSFIILTPVLFMLIYIGKRRSQKLSFMPDDVTGWPWWKLFASTIAFSVWALAVPPLVTGDAGKVVAGFGAVLVSTLLGLIGNVVEPAEAS